MNWIPMKLALIVQIAISGVEDDGQINYLLETPKGRDRQYSISYSTTKRLPFEDKETFAVRGDFECQDVWALDNTPKGMEGAFPWGVPRRSYICNALKMEIDNE